ncbi:hypothetical protein ABH920_006342 [Catenulispora sp. EB89]|uniref:FHA domain-containing protein n=1 Tax=Catenulispora sp. EB89 TaxID=3156257 RepID=UPI0035145BF4
MTAHDPVADLVFAPGTWTAVAGPRSWLLAEASPEDPAVARWWRLIRDAASSDEVLNTLGTTPAAYAFVHRDGDTTRAVVRGAAEAVLHLTDGSLVTIASGADRRVSGALQGFRLSARDQTGSAEASVPLAVGVVPASALGTPMPKPETTSVGFYTQIIAELPWTKRLLGEHSVEDEPVRVTVPDSPVYEPEDVDAEATRRRTWSPRSANGSVTVSAVHCPGEHPNPPEAESCRVCGSPIPDRRVSTVPRPPLGELMLSTDPEPLRLERDVVLGRSPGDTDLPAGRRPDIVRVSDPEVSREHVEIRLDGWQVLVVDLGSRNGTYVAPPAREPELLPPHTPIAISLGTVVHLSEAVSFELRAVR